MEYVYDVLGSGEKKSHLQRGKDLISRCIYIYKRHTQKEGIDIKMLS